MQLFASIHFCQLGRCDRRAQVGAPLFANAQCADHVICVAAQEADTSPAVMKRDHGRTYDNHQHTHVNNRLDQRKSFCTTAV